MLKLEAGVTLRIRPQFHETDTYVVLDQGTGLAGEPFSAIRWKTDSLFMGVPTKGYVIAQFDTQLEQTWKRSDLLLWLDATRRLQKMTAANYDLALEYFDAGMARPSRRIEVPSGFVLLTSR